MILTVFPELESRVYTLILSPSSHTPFGANLSSEASSGMILDIFTIHVIHVHTIHMQYVSITCDIHVH